MERPPTLMGIFAHPDDEVLGCGGTLAQLAKGGVRISLVCATRGEAGEIASPDLATADTLGTVREQEMLCSAEALGVEEVHFLGYRDSGMAGTPENKHPEAFINAPAGEVISRLVALIRRQQPDVVLTFEPFGGYGHPDHIAIHQHTLAAFDAAGDETQYPGAGPAWQPKRLFYPLLPNFFFERMRDAIAAYGGEVSDFDLSERLEKGWPDEHINVTNDVSRYVQAKFNAWNCHRTQFGPGSRFRRLPLAEMAKLLSEEYFALARPVSTPDMRLDGLFAGL